MFLSARSIDGMWSGESDASIVPDAMDAAVKPVVRITLASVTPIMPLETAGLMMENNRLPDSPGVCSGMPEDGRLTLVFQLSSHVRKMRAKKELVLFTISPPSLYEI